MIHEMLCAGECREQTGVLTSVDGGDGVVQMDVRSSMDHDAIQLLPLHCLAKLADNDHVRHEYKHKY